MAEVQSSGESVVAVAKRNGLAPSLGYSWMKAAKEGSKEVVKPVFARVVEAKEKRAGVVVVEVGGASIRVEAGFDAGVLRSVIAALNGAT